MFHMKHVVYDKNNCLFQINLILRPKIIKPFSKGTVLILSFIHTSPQLSPVFNRIARNKGSFRTEFDNSPVSFHCATLFAYETYELKKQLVLLWCGYRESNPNLVLGKDAFYH